MIPGSAETHAPGRPPVTSVAEIEHVALELFAQHGFEDTTVEQIAESAGIGRRTFFRYFRSKNDVAWGDFDDQLRGFQAAFDAVPRSVPLAAALHACILEFNDFPDEELPWLRRRMVLLLGVPALQAHSTLRYQAWRDVVAAFVAGRRDEKPGALVPQVTAHCALGTALSAYEAWLAGDVPLRDLMDRALRAWLAGVPEEVRPSDRR